MSARTESVGHGCGKIAFSVLTVRSLPFTFYAFAYSLEKKNSLAFLEFADNTNRIGAGNAALFELNKLSSQNGSEVVPKRYGATEETSLLSLPAMLRGFPRGNLFPTLFLGSPSNGSSKRTIRVVSSRRCLKVFRLPLAWKEWGNRDCSCQSSGMGGWRGKRETLRLLQTSGFGILS